jgi:hypothetical protein
MMGRVFLALATIASLGVATRAHAQTVTVRLGGQAAQAASRLGVTTAQLQTLVKNQVSALYGLADVDEFLRLSANAASLSSKGLAVDYTTEFDRVIFGVGINGAVATGQSDLGSVVDVMGDALGGSFDRAVPVGAGAQLSLLAGVRLSERLFVFANGLAYPISFSSFSGSGYNVGAHVQYRLGAGLGSEVLAEWGGLVLTTGIELSRASISLEDGLEAPAPLSADFDVRTNATGTLTLTEEALTIPLELTTSVRLLSFLTVFAGVGADVQLGQATFGLDVDATLTGVSGATEYALGTATAVYEGTSDADDVMFRVLAGVELGVGPVHVYTQANLLPKDLSLGLAAGLRMAF